MPKPEWGNKRTCQSCGAKFYDMQKKTIACPKCEAVFEVETKARKPRAPKPPPAAAKPAVVAQVVDDVEVEIGGVEEVEDDDETDAALISEDDEEEEDDLNDVGIGTVAADDDEDT